MKLADDWGDNPTVELEAADTVVDGNVDYDDDDGDEDILPANSPLGRYAAEVGLGHVVASATAAVALPAPAEAVEDDDEHAAAEGRGNNGGGGLGDWLAGAALARFAKSNADSLRRLLAEDDMRELLLVALGVPRPVCGGGFAVALSVAVAVVAVVASLNFPTVTAMLVGVIVAVAVGLRVLSGRLSALLAAGERALAGQRACVRLTRERRQVERGFVLVAGGVAGDDSGGRRRWTALGRAAFESARRLTHTVRRLARDARLGGLAVQAEDAEFGDAFNVRLTPEELAAATDDFGPPALASMAWLLQLHLSDTVQRLLVDWRRCPGRLLLARFRLVLVLTAELTRESAALQARLERQRRLVADVDSLLAEFLGVPGKLAPAAAASGTSPTPMQTALRSLCLQAEALMAKAALAERRPSLLTSSEDLTAEARVHALNAVACCEEIRALMAPRSSQPSPAATSPALSASATKPDQRPVVLVSPDAVPLVEDEFLEVLVPGGDDRAEAASSEDILAADAADAAARRAATRRVLGELDSVIGQRRRLFLERERLARERRGLPPPEPDGDGDGYGDDEDEFPRHRRRRRIVWHGTLEGDGDGDGVVAAKSSLTRISAAAAAAAGASALAAAALAARSGRDVQLREETFSDEGEGEGDSGDDDP